MATDPLKVIGILAGLTEGERGEFFRASSMRHIQAGMNIVTEDDKTTDAFFILSGRVAVKSFSQEGYEVLYSELTEGACFGEFSAIDGAPRAATVEALTSVHVAQIDRMKFRKLLLQFPALGLALSEHLVKRARALSERIFEFSTLPIRSRLSLELLRMTRLAPNGQDSFRIEPAPTHQELASRISTHRETVSREMAYLAKHKLVNSGRKTIEISSIKALRASIT